MRVGAHGYFQLYESLEAYTKADFLTNPSKKHLYLYGSQPFKVLKDQRHSKRCTRIRHKILYR